MGNDETIPQTPQPYGEQRIKDKILYKGDAR